MANSDAAPGLAARRFPLGRSAHRRWNGQLCSAREILMPDDASATQEPAALTERVRFALESGDLDAIRNLLDPGARWGAPEGPNDADCHNRDQVIAWWASARAAGARAAVTEVTAGAGTLLVGLEVTGTPAAREAGGAAERWQVLTVRGDRIADIRGFDDRTAAAARAGVPA
jgi:SnoaL-like domain